jgi:cellulose synthase/poly-beta-1,6-N-acetylglucosamine synthase-like glycosyltransferase
VVWLSWLVGIQFLVILWTLFSYIKHRQKEMPFLENIGSTEINEPVIIVVPAKDEEEAIGSCLERLTYLEKLKNYKIIAVNDRSTDQTEKVMIDQMVKSPEKISVFTVKELPEGWLGKNHACWQGASEGLRILPEAKYILFTDGDVKFHPETLAEAITWMKRKNLTYMSLLEEAEFEGILEPAYLLLFGIFMVFIWARPWMQFKKNGKNYFGNGAFLLFQVEAYKAAEVHSRLRLEVVEDMRSGLLMRSRGENCGVAVGLHRMRRRWQPGFTGVFKGLLKNAFAGFDYSLIKAFAGILLFPVFFFLPWLMLASSVMWPLGVATLTLLILLFYFAGKSSGIPFLSSFLLSPILAFVASVNLAASTLKILKEGGVKWRDTLYKLSDLKAQCFTESKAKSNQPSIF